jgi:hypothetical protein
MADVIPRISGIVRYQVYEGNRLDPAIADSWGSEGVHWRVYDWNYVNQYLQKGMKSNCKYFELHWSTISPFDNLFNEHMLDLISQFWIHYAKEGAPVRATMWYKGTHHILGIPTVWEYTIFLEYHESPAIELPAIVAIFVAIIGIGLVMKWLGFDAGSVNALAAAPFSGMVWVFILGTAFLVALSYYQQHAGFKAPVRPAVPKTPSITPTAPLEYVGTAERVAKGAVPAVSTTATRRRR